jgi:hypothetical protein
LLDISQAYLDNRLEVKVYISKYTPELFAKEEKHYRHLDFYLLKLYPGAGNISPVGSMGLTRI